MTRFSQFRVLFGIGTRCLASIERREDAKRECQPRRHTGSEDPSCVEGHRSASHPYRTFKFLTCNTELAQAKRNIIKITINMTITLTAVFCPIPTISSLQVIKPLHTSLHTRAKFHASLIRTLHKVP